MKVIRIPETLHAELKSEAKREGRTLQYLVERKLSVAEPLVAGWSQDNAENDNRVVEGDWGA